MKAIILTGGTGSRLRPLTYTGAKQLIPVANKPILYYAIEAVRDAGIQQIGLVVGHTHQEIRDAIGTGESFGVDIQYIYQDAPRGLAHAVQISKPFVGDEDFLVFLGDNIVRSGVVEFVRRFRSSQTINSLILLSRVREPERFGVAEVQEGRVVRLIEKPKIPPSDLALVGVYLFDSNIFQAVDCIKPSARNEYEITDAIQYLIDNGFQVEFEQVEGWWKDTGKPEDVLDANRLMLDQIRVDVSGKVNEGSEVVGKAVIEPGAEVIDSVIRGPAIIGKGARIINSYIGPFTSIGERVVIESSEIENSIVLEDTSIRGIRTRIDNSLIGKSVRIEEAPLRPKALQFVLGDNSRCYVQ